MRCDQFMGLNAYATDLLDITILVQEIGKRNFPDGRTEDFDRDVKINIVSAEKSGATFVGMFEEIYPLMTYLLPGGRILTERLQAAPWSSGPCFFLCLTEDGKNIKETLWNDEEIERA